MQYQSSEVLIKTTSFATHGSFPFGDSLLGASMAQWSPYYLTKFGVLQVTLRKEGDSGE